MVEMRRAGDGMKLGFARRTAEIFAKRLSTIINDQTTVSPPHPTPYYHRLPLPHGRLPSGLYDEHLRHL